MFCLLKDAVYSRVCCLCILLTLVGCGGSGNGPGGPGGGPVPVGFQKVGTQTVEEKINLVGTIAANESVDLQARVEGIIEGIEFEEGDRLKKGDVIFRVDEEKLLSKVREAKANFALASTNLNRSKALLQRKTISSQEHDVAQSLFETTRATLEIAERNLAEAQIRAPFDGVLGSRLVSPGQLVRVGDTLASFVSWNPLKLELSVPERFLSSLEKEQEVKLRVSAYPDRNFVGKIFFVAPEIDLDSRTILVKAKVENRELLLKPGMFASASIITDVRPNALTVPHSAVMRQGDETSVYVVNKESIAEIRPITLGLHLDGVVEVRGGLKPGETIVAIGFMRIGPGMPVKDSSTPVSQTQKS